MKLRAHLAILIVGVVLPTMLLSVVWMVMLARQSRALTERGLVDTARAMSVAVDQKVGESIAVLRALARSSYLETGDMRAFHAEAQRVLRAQSDDWENIVLLDPDGRQLLNLRVGPGGRPPADSDPSRVARAVAARVPVVTDLIQGSVLKKPLIPVQVPIVRGDRVVYVLGAAISPKVLNRVLQAQKIAPEAIGAVVDRNMLIIARSRAADRFVGTRATADLVQRIQTAQEGAFVLFTKEGIKVYTGVARSPLTGWTVAFGVPAAMVDASLWSSLWLTLGSGIVVLLVAIGVASVLAGRISRSMLGLASAAPALVRGESVRIPPAAVAEINDVAAAMEQAGRELRHAHAETEGLVASITSILVTLDADDSVERWNEFAHRAFGLAADAVVGRWLHECAIPWDGARVTEAVAQSRSSGQPVRLDDLSYERSDGGSGILTLTVTPILSGDDHRGGLLLLATDLTERRKLEAQLSQAQKLESIGQLAAGVAHEINTPIQFVGDNVRFLQGAATRLQGVFPTYHRLRDAAVAAPPPDRASMEALVREVTDAESRAELDYLLEEVPRAIEESLDGVQRVASIVRALKEFAHPDGGERSAVDLNHALANTLTVARNEIKYVADVATEFGAVPPVLCNAGEMNQVFLNVIVNAAHAIREVVTERGGRGRISIRTTCEDDHVVVAIADTGGGIPESIRDRIFDPFFTTKGIGVGSGQGLAIARNVVADKHHGSLTFETTPGVGTTFYIRVPLQEQPAPALV